MISATATPANGAAMLSPTCPTCQRPLPAATIADEREPVSGSSLVWELTREWFVGVNPALMRERADWQASFLATRFGPEALTGLAVYFGQIGEELVARMLRRDRETARVVAEQDADRREKYPATKYRTGALDVFE